MCHPQTFIILSMLSLTLQHVFSCKHQQLKPTIYHSFSFNDLSIVHVIEGFCCFQYMRLRKLFKDKIHRYNRNEN